MNFPDRSLYLDEELSVNTKMVLLIRALKHLELNPISFLSFSQVAPLNVTVSMAVVHMGSLSEVDMVSLRSSGLGWLSLASNLLLLMIHIFLFCFQVFLSLFWGPVIC